MSPEKDSLFSKYKWVLNEIKFLNVVGWPTAIGFFSDALQIQISTVLVGHSSSTNIKQLLNGLFVGQSIYVITSLIILQGLTTGMTALCAQAFGSSNSATAGIYFYRAFLLAILTCFPIWAFWIKVEDISMYLLGDALEARYAGQYTTIIAFGYPANLYYRLTYGFLQAQQKVFVTTLFFLFSTFLNLILQYISIFILELEALGVAMAYVASVNFVALQFYIYIRFINIHNIMPSFWTLEVLDGWMHFFNYGIAGMLQFVVDTVERRIIPILVIGTLAGDTIQLAVYTILNVFWFLLATLTLGLSTAVTVRVGGLLGEEKPNLSKRAATLSLVVATIFFLGVGALLLILSPWMGYLFTSELELTSRLPLAFKVLGCVIIGDICYIIRGVMNGCGQQNINTVINIVCIIIIGGSLEFVAGYYLEWRAAACYLMMGIVMVLSAVINLFVIYCADWNRLSRNIIKNLAVRNVFASGTQNDTQDVVNYQSIENLLSSQEDNNYANKYRNKFIRLLFRYFCCLLVGGIVFVFAVVY
ncbi:Solute carrier family 47 [Oopsacas minuta]|uniref:Multidrug and toxin extrusion protein n=1 Tax=Oopsacas minuta TaxID=111878 RepID=A0AAV7JQN4_9METZ|nr:Solute carrier family 47 [Oopsacas minuta]